MYDGILGGYDPLISPTGRAFMAGERQGMTPEQMAQFGAISFADAIALKQMADRARMSAQTMQAQQVPQPQPTVVDELRAQVAGAAAAPYRDSGIAALPAQNIGTQAMASGGIVAFTEGGGTRDYSSLSTQELNALSRSKDRATAQAATRELVSRSGYKPAEFPSSELISQRFRPESPLLAPMSISAMEAVPGSAGSTMPGPSRDPGQYSSPFFQTQMDFNEMSPSDPNFRPVSSLGSPGLGLASDPRLLNRIGPKLPDVPSSAVPPAVAPESPTDTFNQSLFEQMRGLMGPVGGVSAPRLDAEKLFAPVSISDKERADIKKYLREEGEASGLPSLLRRGAERVGTEIESAKKGTKKDVWLAAAQAGFSIAGSSDPFGVAVGKAGQQFAGQYATINKELKKELRELNKDQEAYQRSLAEFELNQNAETRMEVERRENKLQARQDKIADVKIKEVELAQRAKIANLQANASAREMQFRYLAAQLKSDEKALDLRAQYADAVRRNDKAAQEQILAAVLAYNERQAQVIAQKERNKQNALLGPGMEAPGDDSQWTNFSQE